MSKINICAPQLGEGIRSLKIIEILKCKNEYVKTDEKLFVVETDKSSYEIESTVTGKIIHILQDVGSVVTVGTPIMIIENQLEDIKYTHNRAGTDNTGNEPLQFPVLVKDENPSLQGLTPKIIGYCRRNNITPETLKSIKGTGKDGNIRLQDIIAFSHQLPSSQLSIHAASLAPKWAEESIKSEEQDSYKILAIQKSQIQLNYAMEQSLTVPQASVSLSLVLPDKPLPGIIYAVAQTSKKYEKLRAEYVDTASLKIYSFCSIGCAIALPNDVLATAVFEAESEVTLEEAKRFCQHQTNYYRRLKGTLPPVKRHSITISDMSGFGIEHATPFVVSPAIATLFIGAPKNDNSSTLVFAFDHRVMNGAYASRVLRSIANKCNVKSV